VVERLRGCCYEIRGAWLWWRYREVIGLIREAHGLRRHPSVRDWAAFAWRVVFY
jgi:hypothetical protein